MKDRSCFFKRLALTVVVLATLTAWRFESHRQTAEGWARFSVEEIEKQNLGAADNAIRSALRVFPRSAHYLGLLGLISGRRGMDSFPAVLNFQPSAEQQHYLQEALLAYNRALAENPDDDVCWHNRGWVRLALGESPRLVLSDFEHAIQLDGAAAAYRISAALVYERLEQPDQAVDQYAAAVMADPSIAHSIFLREMQKNHPSIWRSVLARAISQLQARQEGLQNILIRARLGSLYLTQGAVNRAIPELQAVTAELPQLPRAWANLGRAYSVKGEPSMARECFRKALALDPMDRYMWLQLSFLPQKGQELDSTEYKKWASREWIHRFSSRAARTMRVYGTTAVVSDDLLPPRMLQYCDIPEDIEKPD
jgi:tetratricopeptide (TPR) repeat protein